MQNPAKFGVVRQNRRAHSIVIGAGPAGLTVAYVLSKGSHSVTLLEADDCPGGLARSLALCGQVVDLGPHRFFSTDRRVNELWLEVVRRDYAMVKRQTRILYHGKLFQYPLESLDCLLKLGIVEAGRCLASYARELSRLGQLNGSFESLMCHRFGKRLYEIFFKTYSEKLWGIPCTELDADFAKQRIKNFTLSAAIKRAVFPRTSQEHRTLVDEFAYPTGGTGMVYERMAQAVRERGGQVRLKTPVRKVVRHRGKVVGVELMSGEKVQADHVISTMPLTSMVMGLGDVPPEVVNACRELQFRNTILVYLEVLNHNPFPDNWIYVHSPDVRFGRVTNFRNWVPQLYGDSPNAILVMEYWCNGGDEFWQRNGKQLEALARDEILRTGLVDDPDKLGRGFVFRIPKCYPVYRRGYQQRVRLIKDYLSTIAGLQVIGRYGSFKYNNQDHSILMGILAAENILSSASNDLWSVNADYDTYQEDCSISETGLVPAR